MELPADLSDEERQALKRLAHAAVSYATSIAVDEHLIRHWCEAFDDLNPLYLDGEYARAQGHRDVVAPPTAVWSTFSQPYRPLVGGSAARHLHFDVKRALRCSAAIVAELEIENHAFLQVGDRLQIDQHLISVSPLRTTKLGSGRYWVIQRRFSSTRGDLIAVQRMTAFGYGRIDRERDGTAAVEATIGVIPRLPSGADDICVGTLLPEQRIPVTALRSIYVASASRDFGPQHCDSRYAATTPAGEIFVSSPFVIGMISRYLSDWGGYHALVRRVQVTFGRSISAGEEMILNGEVTEKRTTDSGVELDLRLEVSSTRGPAIRGSASLSLPDHRNR